MQAGGRWCSEKEGEDFLRSIKLTLVKALVNLQSIRTRKLKLCQETELHCCLIQLCMCICVKKLCKENNKRENHQRWPWKWWEVEQLYVHRCSTSCPLVLLLVEARHHPLQFAIVILSLGVACTYRQVMLAEACYFRADTSPASSQGE